MDWTRHRDHFTTTFEGEPVAARRESGGWRLTLGDETLRVANPHLRTWNRTRPVLERVLRAHRSGALPAPSTPSWLGASTDRRFTECMPRVGRRPRPCAQSRVGAEDEDEDR